jgi:hypothetical protein
MTLNIDDAFSNFLKASDLGGKPRLVIIDHVTMEEIGQKKERKAIIHFQDQKKPMVLNKVNANNIKAMFGPMTETWIGKQIVLFEAMVDFGGKTVPGLRVRPPKSNGHVPANFAPSYPPPGLADDEMEDAPF